MAMLGMLCVGLLMLAAEVIGGLVMFSAMLRFSTGRQELGELFDFGANLSFTRDHIGQLLMGLLIMTVATVIITIPFACLSGVLSLVPICGQILAFLLALPLMFYIALVFAHIQGQIAREAGLGAAGGYLESY